MIQVLRRKAEVAARGEPSCWLAQPLLDKTRPWASFMGSNHHFERCTRTREKRPYESPRSDRAIWSKVLRSSESHSIYGCTADQNIARRRGCRRIGKACRAESPSFQSRTTPTTSNTSRRPTRKVQVTQALTTQHNGSTTSAHTATLHLLTTYLHFIRGPPVTTLKPSSKIVSDKQKAATRGCYTTKEACWSF